MNKRTKHSQINREQTKSFAYFHYTSNLHAVKSCCIEIPIVIILYDSKRYGMICNKLNWREVKGTDDGSMDPRKIDLFVVYGIQLLSFASYDFPRTD